MKKVILSLCLMLGALQVSMAAPLPNEISIQDVQYGSGTPGQDGTTVATEVSPGLYQAPQYMPGYPTSATLFPRVVNVDCTQTGEKIVCGGYNWLPSLGRGEYLLIHPVITKIVEVAKPTPAVVVSVPVKRASIYFDLNKSNIKPEFDSAIAAVAKSLNVNANSDVTVAVIGNTDQRDNEKYNLALGLRRANAVKARLVSLGVAENRITAVSYGKKFVRLPCLLEKCYKENRRVDIVTSR